MLNIHHPIFYAVLMIVAGLGIPIMAAINTGLSGKIQNSAIATIILLLVGLIAAVCVLAFNKQPLSSPFSAEIPLYYYTAGLLYVFYISTITWVAPKFGVGNAVAFVLLGQLISMVIIDHFSLFNAIHYPLTWKRLTGLVLMMAGIYLVVKKN